MNISIIGSGYVGLVTGTCLAEIGHNVICVDNNINKIKKLNEGKVPFYEPSLEPLIRYNVNEGRLKFSSEIGDGVKHSEVIFLCVGTPSLPDGSANLGAVKQVVREIAQHMDSYKLVVEKSTVPVQTGEWLDKLIYEYLEDKSISYDIASNPEFLREGTAVHDFIHSDRIVIGVNSDKAANLLIQIYTPLNAPILITDINSAELIKHASNAFLATKISFINFVASICEKTGADISKVKIGIGMDKRIGMDFLNAGIGFGGSCFPKDVSAFMAIAQKVGVNPAILKSVEDINIYQREYFITKIIDTLHGVKNKDIAILGLSFKPDTDDIRQAPSLRILEILKKEGANLRVYDPAAMDNVKEIYPHLYYAQDAYDAISGSIAAVFVTEWKVFKELDFLKIKNETDCTTIFDGRNIFNSHRLEKLGFKYYSIGRANKIICV
ncbi:MAG TPA: UDP-glucose/GDP-mannose dehydrogenase family protein [Candidatus Eremiobacteraeota bacterium]|nr:MAG: UDP-glucose 6-dehydrogenase YwqF [bacterium ADurb.Bin363]HPZ09726.1 UDP-glucose/GDP-mannose dehydrogenase family protein [Candidatus Eremiobacteraeota bacterium]